MTFDEFKKNNAVLKIMDENENIKELDIIFNLALSPRTKLKIIF
jgi:hypothetical protein